MIRTRMMVLAGVSLLAGARDTSAQAVFVDVGIGTPQLGARVVWASPPPVVVYEPAPVYYYPAPVRIVYVQTLPVAYWEWVRVHDPYRYSRMRSWLHYERAYDRAWRLRDRTRYEELRAREYEYFRDRAEFEHAYRAWKIARHEDRGRGRGRGRRW